VEAERVNVLSIDGGGVRGIIPAVVLGELERLTGRPVASLFHLIAGTSTGGLLALGLTTPAPGPAEAPRYRADDLAAAYETAAGHIFFRPAGHQVTASGNPIEEKYPSTGLEEVLHLYFGDARLSEVLTDVLVPAYELERRLPFFFRSSRARIHADYDFPLRVAAQATAAAPTYFEPVHVDGFTLVDGGVYANNPALCAYVEAIVSWPEAAEILVVSLGTGETTDGVGSIVGHQLEQLCNRHTDSGDGAGRRRYWRLQPVLPEGHAEMDDARPENLRTLRSLGEELVTERRADLEVLAARLVSGCSPRLRPLRGSPHRGSAPPTRGGEG